MCGNFCLPTKINIHTSSFSLSLNRYILLFLTFAVLLVYAAHASRFFTSLDSHASTK